MEAKKKKGRGGGRKRMKSRLEMLNFFSVEDSFPWS